MTNASPSLFTADQQTFLLSAKAWWQESEQALDFLAERTTQESQLARISAFVALLRQDSTPAAAQVVPLLRSTRSLTGNRALNRTLETDGFASLVRQLLFGEEALPERLAEFLAYRSAGPLIASHLLFVAFPDRYPLLHPVTRGRIIPTRAQFQALREQVNVRYPQPPEMSPEVRDFLADMLWYEAIRAFLQVSDFLTVHSILWHARDLPPPSQPPLSTTVREETAAYTTNDPSAASPAASDEQILLTQLEFEIAAQGFTYPPLTIRNYYIALKTKPFVLLTGLSGTGKTQLTRLFALGLTGAIASQYLLLPVRADWHDSTPLLGYYNVLTDRYLSTPFLEFLRQAAQAENAGRTFFACLDEMNLARVDYYFADILSAMETSERYIPLSDNRRVILPGNLFLSGSVNMDEATFPFSRKVLDRANTLEFREISFAPVSPPPLTPVVPLPYPERQRLFLDNRVLTVSEATSRLAGTRPTVIPHVIERLSRLNELLTPKSQHFGYRVRDEILRYVAASFTTAGTGLFDRTPEKNVRIALDLQIEQKVLPRLSGTWESLERLLTELERWITLEGLPRSAAKLARMRQRAAEDGFVTFYEV